MRGISGLINPARLGKRNNRPRNTLLFRTWLFTGCNPPIVAL